MEGLLVFGSIVFVIILSVVAFYYAFPYLLKLFLIIPKWIIAFFYSYSCVVLAADSYNFERAPYTRELLFLAGLIMILTVTLIKQFYNIFLKLFFCFIFIISSIIISYIAIPLFWPASLYILSQYLLLMYGGWYFISWLKLYDHQA